jgi:translation initiation factor 2 alpha subunit (eIF-2alpha)
MKNDFKKWAYIHYEVVYFLEELQQDLDDMPKTLLDVLEKDYVESIYDLSIEITNEFMDLYKDKGEWNYEWIEDIKEFIDKKLS